MTRMWGVDPKYLCRQHLLGEHNELHKLVGAIQAGHAIEGYVQQDQIDTSLIQSRHAALVRELERRGYSHDSPLAYDDHLDQGAIDPEANLEELTCRCESCRNRARRYGVIE